MKKSDYLKLKQANLPNTKKLVTDEIINKTGRNYIIKLNYNENKFGCSPRVKEEIALFSPNIYPEYIDYDILSRITKLSGIKEEQIYFSNGSDSILDHIPKIFGSLKSNPNVIIPSLTYARIENTCTIFDLKIKKVDLVDNKINLNKMLESIGKNTTIVYVVNPNMPTGAYNTHKEIIDFLKKVPKDVLVVLDEAYIEFAEGIEQSYKYDKEIINKFENVIITRTFSKLFGIASFRIGYCFGSNENIDIIKRTSQYFPVSKYSFQAATAALSDIEYYNDLLVKINHEKEYLYKEFDKLKLNYIKSYGNFIYIDLSNEKRFTNKQLEDYILNEYGVLIRCIQTFGIRITIGTHFENELLIKAMKEFMNKLK